MDPSTLSRKALYYATSLARFGEVVAGSREEKKLIEVLKGYVEDYVDNLWLEPVPVTSWSEVECRIVMNQGVEIRCAHQPGSASGHVVGKAIVLRESEFLKKVWTNRSYFEDRIVIVKELEDPDDIALIAQSIDGVAKALIVINDDDYLRRIVVLKDYVPTYGKTELISIPVVVVSKSFEHHINKHSLEDLRIEVCARSSYVSSYGYNVVMELNNRSDEMVYISAHHDHWYQGFTDNLLGLGILLALVRDNNLRAIAGHRSIRLVSFTAEEGFPQPISPFYWLVGSRYHTQKNIEDIINYVDIAINFDVVYKGLELASTGIEIHELVKTLNLNFDEITFDQIIFDSYAFSRLGIPALTIHSFSKVLEEGIYHSQKDVPTYGVMPTLERLFLYINKLLHHADRHHLVSSFRAAITKTLFHYHGKGCLSLELIDNIGRYVRLMEHLDVVRAFSMLKTFNRLAYACYITSEFFTKAGTRERIDFMPWVCDEVIEIPIGIDYRDKRLACLKLQSLSQSLDIVFLSMASKTGRSI